MVNRSSLRLTLIMALAIAACERPAADSAARTDAAAAVQPPDADSFTVEGLLTPESALYDEVADLYLVSNINGGPFEKDDNGFISRVRPDGSVESLRWIDGAADSITLHAPKGMAIHGDTLFVADIDFVRFFHRLDGRPLGARNVRGATFLNDLAVGSDGTLYVSDSGYRPDFSSSGTEAVHRFENSRSAPVVRGAGNGAPNGLAATPEGIIIVGGGRKIVHAKTAGGAPDSVAALPAGGMDGVIRLADGSLLVSSWEGKAVYRVDPAGGIQVIMENIESPADIGYDTKRGRVPVPVFTQNRLVVRKH